MVGHVEPAWELEKFQIKDLGEQLDVKIQRLEEWLANRDVSLDDAWFYSDSHNDLPLLEKVDHPIAVDPDATLDSIARARNWRIISLR